MTLDTSLAEPLSGIRPEVRTGSYVLVGGEIPPQLNALGSVTTNGLRSFILTKAAADAAGLRYPFAAVWLAVRIHSSVKAARFAATVNDSLAGAGIRCVVVRGFAHTHLFVPEKRADDALAVLAGMTRGGAFD